MEKVKSKIILLSIGICFLSNSFATTGTTTVEQNAEFQKEADKYKELYEKYQKLADEANQPNVVKNPQTKQEIVDKPTKPDLVEDANTNTSGDTTTAKSKKSDTEYKFVAEPWKGTDFGLGGTIATGDSATTNVNAMSNISYTPFERWNNKAFLNYVYSTNDKRGERAVKINKTQIRGETSWDFTKKNAAYGRINYLNDELSTYDFIFTESVGYKRKVYENDAETMKVELSAGPSFMQSKITGKDFEANEPGFQATFDYVWNFTDNSSFKQNILYNYDKKNRSIYQGISTLSVKVYKNFSLQLTFQLNGTTLVTPGKNNINTITSTNIMYTL